MRRNKHWIRDRARRLLVPPLAALVAVAGFLVLSPGARGAEIPQGAEYSETYITSLDGTLLHTDVFKPVGLSVGTRVPVILVVSPYLNSGGFFIPPQPTTQGPVVLYPELITEGHIFEKGYAMVQVSLRGYGGSGGCADLGGSGEQADVKTAVEWAASQPWSTGRVGMYGASYDGWTQVMALATKPVGLAAVVIGSPIVSAYRSMFMNGMRYGGQWPLLPVAYGAGDLQPPSVYSPLDYWANGVTGTTSNPGCYFGNLTNTFGDDAAAPYWGERDLVSRAAGSRVPVLWSHGFLDANVKPDNIVDVWSTIAGPKRAWFGQWGHDWGSDGGVRIGRAGFVPEAMAWLGRYLKNEPSAPLTEEPPVVIQQDDGRWRAERVWPPADAEHHPLPVRPGAYLDTPGNNGESVGQAFGTEVSGPLPTGNGTWTFTQPLPYDVHLAGASRLSATLQTSAPGAHLVVLLYDVDGTGQATLITRGAYLLRNEGTSEVSFDLYPQDWRVETGHRLGLLLSGADDLWFAPPMTSAIVDVQGGGISVPFLRLDRDRFLDGGPSLAMEGRGPFQVEQRTIEEATVQAPLPPSMRPPG